MKATIVHSWTKSAVICYERHSCCIGCPVIKNLETLDASSCKMAIAVMQLLEKLGKPDAYSIRSGYKLRIIK